MDLGSSSGLAASLLKAGGKQIQKELDKNYPKGISPGDIAETSGGSLNCNAVFHGTLPYWYSKKKLNKKPEEACILEALSKHHVFSSVETLTMHGVELFEKNLTDTIMFPNVP